MRRGTGFILFLLVFILVAGRTVFNDDIVVQDNYIIKSAELSDTTPPLVDVVINEASLVFVQPDTYYSRPGGKAAFKTKVNGSTELSLYIATQLLKHVEKIDLSGFKKQLSAMTDAEIISAVDEAYHQNPYVGLMSGFTLDKNNAILKIDYKTSVSDAVAMQDTVYLAVQKAIKDIHINEMTILEKIEFINEYLTGIAVYDTEASLDIKNKVYDNSRVPYGVFIKGKGVCSAFAGAFQIMAGELGLESVVVLGTCDGREHAWNRVLVGENWLTIDVTNNNSGKVSNAFYLLPDSLATLIYVEHDNYLQQGAREKMVGESENYEWYRSRNLYVNKEDLRDYFATKLLAEKSVAVRTNYELTLEEAVDIVTAAMTKSKIRGTQVSVNSICGVIMVNLN